MNTGTGRARGADDFEHFPKELPAWVELLQLLVVGILAVLGDQQNRVDGELAGSESEGIGDRGAQPNVMLCGMGPAEIGRGRNLLDEQAGDLERRLVQPMSVVNDKPVEESADDVVGMRQVVVDARERRDFGTRRCAFGLGGRLAHFSRICSRNAELGYGGGSARDCEETTTRGLGNHGAEPAPGRGSFLH